MYESDALGQPSLVRSLSAAPNSAVSVVVNGDAAPEVSGHDGWIYFSSNQIGNFDIWRLKPIGEFAVQPKFPTPTAGFPTPTK